MPRRTFIEIPEEMSLKFNSILFDEESFAEILRFERKRTDRSQRPFLLMLLDFSSLFREGRRQRQTLIKNVIQSLKLAIRQTDMMGWYKNNTVMGVIFTELQIENYAVGKILARVKAVLRTCSTAEQIAAITVSVHVYPHRDLGGPGSSASDKLYPELKRRRSARLLKRMIDIFGSLGLLVLLAPVLVVVGVAIKLTSNGPILFKQTRIGQLGRPFTILKFRSMYVDADSKTHEQYVKDLIVRGRDSDGEAEALRQDGLFKLSRDSRITPLGHFIRKTSIDELPQLLNVLAGSMSLVGPRPHPPYEVECYDTWHVRRVLEARPGLTGLWQVKGRSRSTYDDMVRLDLKYIDIWSVWNDLKILLQTPWAVFRGEGAR
jgi:lipopolysaccharide/colanic/teichoic acid biosynthesis glycosyltransferase